MEAKKIIITGGATRIGAAIANKLSGPNKEIVIHFNKSKSKAEDLKKKLSLKGSKIDFQSLLFIAKVNNFVILFLDNGWNHILPQLEPM